MVLHRDTGEIEHKHFYDIVDYFKSGDVLVLNNTKVIPARLIGIKEETGADIITAEPICLYSISSYGLLCYCEIEKLGDMIDSEIEKVEFFDDIPENLTYPDTHALLFKTAKEYKRL